MLSRPHTGAQAPDFGEQEVLAGLPYDLRGDLSIHVHGQTVSRVALFASADRVRPSRRTLRPSDALLLLQRIQLLCSASCCASCFYCPHSASIARTLLLQRILLLLPASTQPPQTPLTMNGASQGVYTLVCSRLHFVVVLAAEYIYKIKYVPQRERRPMRSIHVHLCERVAVDARSYEVQSALEVIDPPDDAYSASRA
jgi:hypothetical protein